MHPRLLPYYNRELQHLREMCGEFGKAYPKIAGRLGIEGFECADPYVERLLEGFGYMAARVRLKVDAEFPRFTQHLLDMVYPHYLSPLPSMTVVQFQPDLTEGSLADGYTVPRGSALRSRLGKGEQTPCEYRTSQDVTLWPLELAEVEYLSTTSAVSARGIATLNKVKAAVRLRLRATAGLTFDKLALDKLTIHLRGTEQVPMRLYEQLLGQSQGVVLQPAKSKGKGKDTWLERLPAGAVKPVGFADSEALLPVHRRSFQGYRLLQEYFAFAERYMLVSFEGLQPAVRRCSGNEIDLYVLLGNSDPSLDGAIDVANFALHCTPAINLFEKRADRVHLNNKTNEYHIVPDRSRPQDFEVYSLLSLTGFGTSNERKQEFKPFYATHDLSDYHDTGAFYTLYRQPRVLSGRQRSQGPRSSYIGSEAFVSLVDGAEAPFSHDLRQLAPHVLCTNRDLPLHMALGMGQTDFTLDSGGPVQAVRCLAGPTRPRPSRAHGHTAWQVISHLSLNYLSITEGDPEEGAAGLRQLLGLYGIEDEASVRQQIEGVAAVSSRPIHRRMPGPGPIAIGRGLEVTLTLDESAFEGAGIFLLGQVMEQFSARYVSINSFTEMVLKSVDRGEIMRWPARIGQRQVL